MIHQPDWLVRGGGSIFAALWPSFSKKRKTIRGTGDLGLPQHTANSQRLSHVHTAVVHLVGLCKSHLSVLFTPDMPSNGLIGSARLGFCGFAIQRLMT